MSAADNEEIAARAARLAVEQFVNSPAFTVAVASRVDATLELKLESYGIDTHHPDKTRADFVSLREWNEFWRFIRNKGVGTVITWLMTGALAALATGLYIRFK